MNKPTKTNSGGIKFSSDSQTLSSAGSLLGQKGGHTTSNARASASRENGKLGGRPTKSDVK